MSLLIMTIVITLNMGDIAYNVITYSWFLLTNDFTYNDNSYNT